MRLIFMLFPPHRMIPARSLPARDRAVPLMRDGARAVIVARPGNARCRLCQVWVDEVRMPVLSELDTINRTNSLTVMSRLDYVRLGATQNHSQVTIRQRR